MKPTSMPEAAPTLLEPRSPEPRTGWRTFDWLGLAVSFALALGITALAEVLGPAAPRLGAAVLAILLGIALRSSLPLPGRATAGTGLLGQKALQFAIILLGGSVDLLYVGRVAGGSLLVMLGTLSAGLFGIWQIGRLLGIQPRLRSLLCAGTSICGASAIAAVAPAVGADAGELSYAVSVIFIFNIAAVILFPILGHALHFSNHTFGVWAGTAVNDTSSVLAAGYAFGAGAASYAAVVKLSRTVMILPVTIFMALLSQCRVSPAEPVDSEQVLRRVHPLAVAHRALPWFIVIFVLASAAYTLRLWTPATAHHFGTGAQYATVFALAAVGLSTDLRKLLRVGHRPVLLGLCGWILVAATSLMLQGVVALLAR
jgi:uncharacterized integral membrane protein (TIGR00698 family)